MTDPAIAQMIREILAEELAKIRATGNPAVKTGRKPVREEIVSIGSDANLNDFVLRVLDLGPR